MLYTQYDRYNFSLMKTAYFKVGVQDMYELNHLLVSL